MNQNAPLLSIEARTNSDISQRSEMLNDMVMEITFNDLTKNALANGSGQLKTAKSGLS